MELIVLHDQNEHRVHLEQRGDGTYQISVGDRAYEVNVVSAGDILSLVLEDGRQFEVAVRRAGNHGSHHYQVSSSRGLDTLEIMDPLTHLLRQSKGESEGSGRVAALMPGRVVEILLEEGAAVEKGQGVVVVEAMKMKNEIQAETSGRVVRIFVEPGQNVEGGDPLFEVE